MSSNCVELIFVKVHLSTLGASGDAVFSILKGRKNNRKNCVSRRSQSQKMTLYKDIIICQSKVTIRSKNECNIGAVPNNSVL